MNVTDDIKTMQRVGELQMLIKFYVSSKWTEVFKSIQFTGPYKININVI